MRNLASNALTLVIVAGVLVAGMAVYAVQLFSAPGPLTESKRVVLERNDSLAKASERLAEAGVISNATIFRLGARYRDAAQSVKFGEYEIPAAASMEEVLEIIVAGKSLQYKVTIAEGLTSWEIVEALKSVELLSGEIDAIPPEGSLAPDTYFVARGASRAELLGRMHVAQEKILAEAWDNRAPDLPLENPAEALTLASIVEKETGVASERDLVAGVFVNRLKRRMRLQSDSTIIYGLTNGQGPLGRGIRRSEINKPTPYNTYVIDRLPPGPIANPGRAAIEAVMNPKATKALYFVADGSGGHAFAESLREHERNVAKWRKIETERASQ